MAVYTVVAAVVGIEVVAAGIDIEVFLDEPPCRHCTRLLAEDCSVHKTGFAGIVG